MEPRRSSDVSHILARIESGDPSAADQLLPLVYEELRKLAAAKLAQERPGQTLQATALVHEAYIRLVQGENPQQWDNRGHFFAAAAEAMRRILIDSVRHKQSLKAGHGYQRRDLDDMRLTFAIHPQELLDLDEALEKLKAINLSAFEMARLRLFTGLSVEEASDLTCVSRRTGFRQWTYARAFLQAELSDQNDVIANE
jgi:RNA polymerase sigma factor (TIGR02999 family)